MDMRRITQAELNKIIDEHQEWIISFGRGGQKADLSNCDISGLDMRRANLFNGIFINTNMSFVNLTYANLSHTNMARAILEGADLSFTNLSFSNLTMADLSGTILDTTLFYRSRLISCNFKGSIYSQSAIFKDVILDKTCVNIPSLPMACPDTGAFTGWKKCRDRCGGPIIVKLLIPEDAKRTSATGRKCRCNKAIVLDIEGADVAYSMHDIDFVYRIGETVEVDNFEEDRFIECAPGIHFFINKQEAMDYNI